MKLVRALSFIYFIKCVWVIKANEEKIGNYTYRIPENNNNDDVWAWGYTEISIPNRMNDGVSTEASVNKSSPSEIIRDPCLPYNPSKPNFNADGKRTSEQKCLEYQWEIKTAAEIRNRKNKCEEIRFIEAFKESDGNIQWPEVVGGHDTSVGEFPHMGAIGWKSMTGAWVFKCGGTLISRQFVLTAAHCSRASPLDTTLADTVPKIVRLSTKNIHLFHVNIPENSTDNYRSLPNDVKIIQVIVHPSYMSPKKYFDIALMKLEREVRFTLLLHPACLWTKPDLGGLGSTATLTGWGVLKPGDQASSDELQSAVLDLLDSKQCDQLLQPRCNRHFCNMMEHQLCAGKLTGGVDSCQGDSGGPLQVKMPLTDNATKYNLYYVIGVTSFGTGCALPDTPGIYTRVSSFVSWIESIVWL